jgi:hypothetical protein
MSERTRGKSEGGKTKECGVKRDWRRKENGTEKERERKKIVADGRPESEEVMVFSKEEHVPNCLSQRKDDTLLLRLCLAPPRLQTFPRRNLQVSSEPAIPL